MAPGSPEVLLRLGTTTPSTRSLGPTQSSVADHSEPRQATSFFVPSVHPVYGEKSSRSFSQGSRLIYAELDGILRSGEAHEAAEELNAKGSLRVLRSNLPTTKSMTSEVLQHHCEALGAELEDHGGHRAPEAFSSESWHTGDIDFAVALDLDAQIRRAGTLLDSFALAGVRFANREH